MEAVKQGQSDSVAYSVLPMQMGVEWTDAYYIKCIRSIVAEWNFNVNQFNPNALTNDELGLPLRFAERSQYFKEYYFGRQKNIDFQHILLKEDGSRKLIKMFRNKDIMKFVNYSIQQIITFSKRAKDIIEVKGVSKNVVSKKKFNMDFQKFILDTQNSKYYKNSEFKDFFQSITGTKFGSDAKEQALGYDFSEGIDDAAQNVAKDVYHRNYLDELFVEMGKDGLMSGLLAAKISIENGYVLVEHIPSTEAIFPPTINGDQHRSDQYGGRLRFLTPSEIFAKYGDKLTDAIKTEIQSMAYSQSGNNTFYNLYNNTYGNTVFNWWGNMGGTPRVAVAEVQWASYKKGDADRHRQCLREGILIGNKYLIGQGESTNQTTDWRNATHTNLDYKFCQPMSIFGQNMGMPEILYTYENQKDFLQTKINEWITQTKGTFYFIMAENIPEGEDVNSMMAQVSDTRLVAVKGTDMDKGEIHRFMEQGAIEMPRDVAILFSELSRYSSMMADVLNIPDQARGQMQGYQPIKTLSAQLAQSSKGTMYFYEPIQKFYQRILEHSVNKFMTSTLLNNSEFEYELIVGDTEMQLFKATKDAGLSRYGLYMDFEDIMDDAGRQRSLDIIFAYAQNPTSGYTMSDYWAVENMDTSSEIESYFNFRDNQIKEQKALEQQQQQQMQQQQMQINSQTQENMAVVREIGADKRQEKQLISTETIEEMKVESKENIQTAVLLTQNLLKQQDLELAAMNQQQQPNQPNQQ